MSAMTRTLRFTLNGESVTARVAPHHNLVEMLQQQFALFGARESCGQGLCGCCTVLIDGEPARSCLMLAATAEGARIDTVEGLAKADGTLHPLQEAFQRHHGLQCGFCTPGFLMLASTVYRDAPAMTDEQIRTALGGQLCRCTGYVGIVRAVRAAAALEDER